jgi:hypothetical protein
MECQTAGHQIEALVFERQTFHVRYVGGHVREPALGRELPCLGQHGIGEVRRDDGRNVRGKSKRRVAGTGSDVQHAPMRPGSAELDQELEALTTRMNLTSGVRVWNCTKLPLNSVFVCVHSAELHAPRARVDQD